MGAVIGAPDEQAVVATPVFVNPCGELLESGDVAVQRADGFVRKRARGVHDVVVVRRVVEHDVEGGILHEEM